MSFNLAVVVLLSNLSVKLGWRKRCRELPSAVEIYNLLYFPVQANLIFELLRTNGAFCKYLFTRLSLSSSALITALG